MSFQMASDWKQRGLQLQAVKDRCNSILRDIALPEEDARAQGIIHVRQLCNTLAAVTIKLCQNAEINSNVPAIMRLLGLQDPKALNSVLKDLNDNSKTSFVTMAQFALENCIERVLDAVPGDNALGSFGKSSKRLMEVAGLSDQSTKHDIIMVPAWIRNTLHAAGIHGHDSKTIVIAGEPYIFEKGKRFQCASWSHLFYAFQHGLEIYREMLVSPVVSSIARIPIV